MSKVKYDGWCMKDQDGIISGSFHRLRKDVVIWWDSRFWTPLWKNMRGQKKFRLIKVRIVEVNDGQ